MLLSFWRDLKTFISLLAYTTRYRLCNFNIDNYLDIDIAVKYITEPYSVTAGQQLDGISTCLVFARYVVEK